MNMTPKQKAQAIAAGVSLAPMASYAVAPATIADLTNAISFADVSLGILAVSGLLISVYVVKKGAFLILVMVNGSDSSSASIRDAARINRERAERFNATGSYD
jgi:hypothetical protein